MLPTLISKIQQDLGSKTFLKLESVTSIIPEKTKSSTIKQLMIYVQSYQVNFEMICFLAIEKERKLLIQYDRWSNIANGFIINEMEIIQEKIEFDQKQVKEFRIIGFLKKEFRLSQIKEQLKITTSDKKHKYVNKQLLSLKNGINPRMVKQAQNQEFQNKIKESQKSQKINHKSNNRKTEQNKIKPIQKRPSKDMNNLKETNTPNKMVGKNIQSEATKGNNKKVLKMNIQSDQEYYDKNQFNKLMDLQPGNPTDCSDKKIEKEEIKESKKHHIHMSKFVEDDEEEALFDKMQKVSKKGQMIKEKIVIYQQKIIPQASQKEQNKSKKGVLGHALSQKGGLMGWLSKK